jgi:lipopolysaccharide biosynthesis glycosyltransferase
MNAVVVVSIGRDKFLQYAQPTLEDYCQKYGLALEIITTAQYKLGIKQGYNYGTFEKFQVNKFTDKYDRILRLDSDVIITPKCPNVFDIVDEDSVGVVFEDEGRRQPLRRAELRKIQDQLGELNWHKYYFNSGVVVSSKRHKAMYEFDEKDLEIVRTKNLGSFKEQSYLNWKTRKLGFLMHNLGYRFNHLSMFTELGHDRKKSCIIHYAGAQDVKEKNMKNDFSYFYSKNTTIRGEEVSEILEVSTHHDDADSIRIDKSSTFNPKDIL